MNNNGLSSKNNCFISYRINRESSDYENTFEFNYIVIF